MISKGNHKKHIFRFKQFSLTDDNCGMKIGTDGVLLGAIAANEKCNNVLDIGTGSGLIALMIAQKQPAEIECIEIDPLAYNDALFNIDNSPWTERIKLYKTPFQEFYRNTKKKYGLIVCNPPYFHNSKESPNANRHIARHSDKLPLTDLLEGVSKILSNDGKFLIIIPALQYQNVNNFLLKKNNLFTNTKILIRPTPSKDFHRVILSVSKQKSEINEDFITIENGQRHIYSREYQNLIKDYLL